MQVIILAAGQGTRLRPYTNDRPKCMVELVGKPLLHHQLEVLRSCGLNDIALVGGYCADGLQAEGIDVVINERYAETNMVSTLFCAEALMQEGQDLLITYGDIIYEPRVLQAVLQNNAFLSVAVDRQWRKFWAIRMENPLADAETLKLDAQNCIVELGKKPNDYSEIQGQYLGLIKVRGDQVAAFRAAWHVLDRQATYDGKDFDNMYMTSFLQHLINEGWEAKAAFTDNGWLEVDTVEDLDQYHHMHEAGQLASFMLLSV
ncbi:phosphocholine cytidylyltransferase family protein [Pseudomonas sp. YeP6b]|uniref:phosphocholine cytidylyltransferase family protein n=1 Tax=Pseudomonas sp. YeP6b TaxID=2861775 RepID=UPI0021D89AE5|nr:phosphocholine cytidylyltransferase family protein [Pseudomonas sp. YeP6b]UXZ21262.1 phosphocholine cytidylyltransferase family protein [Pseudomonas sp. YeP6b]